MRRVTLPQWINHGVEGAREGFGWVKVGISFRLGIGLGIKFKIKVGLEFDVGLG